MEVLRTYLGIPVCRTPICNLYPLTRVGFGLPGVADWYCEFCGEPYYEDQTKNYMEATKMSSGRNDCYKIRAMSTKHPYYLNLVDVKNIKVEKKTSTGEYVELTPSYNANGRPYYNFTVVHETNKKKTRVASRLLALLVADEKRDNPRGYTGVRHLDGDVRNCDPDNIEWFPRNTGPGVRDDDYDLPEPSADSSESGAVEESKESKERRVAIDAEWRDIMKTKRAEVFLCNVIADAVANSRDFPGLVDIALKDVNGDIYGFHVIAKDAPTVNHRYEIILRKVVE